MVRILHLVDQFYPERAGGVERYLYFLTNQISSKSFRLISSEIKFFQKSAKSFGISQPYGIKAQIIGHPIAVEERIDKFIKNNSIDIIHVHHSAPFGLYLLQRLAKKYPLILHWHDYFVLCQKTQLINYQNQICSGPSITKCTLCIQNKKTFLKKLLIPFSLQLRIINAHKLFEACAAIVIPQVSLSHKIPKKFRKKCFVIPYQSEPQWELDLEIIENRISTKDIEPNSWCVMGGPSQHKGIFEFIDELKTIGFKGQLNIFGEGWDNVVKFPPFVKVRGRLLSKEQLAKCSHLIIPSRWQETGPLVAIEGYKMNLHIWAKKGSITHNMASLYDISLFEHARDINRLVKTHNKTLIIPTWKSILRSYELLYTKLV